MKEPLYCTWSHRADLPTHLQVRFSDLDDLVRRVIISAQKSLTIVTPYLSSAGFQLLEEALALCAERRVWIRIITHLCGEPAAANIAALCSLFDSLGGSTLLHRTRVLSARSGEPFIHAKLVVADARNGYIGSANLSARGLGQNFELGVRLTPSQARATEELLDWLESQGRLVERRYSPLGRRFDEEIQQG